MEHSQPQQQQIPDLPEGVCPFTAHETEVDRVNAVPHHEVHEEVPENKHNQHDARQTHPQPGEHFKVVALAGGAVIFHTINLVIAQARNRNA